MKSSVPFDKNFILSGLNLAFLGHYFNKEIDLQKNLYNWPDGIFSRISDSKIKKMPGKNLILNLKFPKDINKIYIIGNLSNKGKKFMEDYFKKDTIHYSLPFGSISEIKNNYELDKYIILFPFCSPHLTSKKWPYYNDLINMINEKFENKFKVVTAPGPDEIEDAKNINALCILDNGKALNISQLSGLIKDSSFVVANDTGPAHITAHLGSKGVALFGSHTTPFKVSIERDNFKAIQAPELSKLSAEKVFERLFEIIS